MTQHIFDNDKAEEQFHECFSGKGFYCNPCHRVFKGDLLLRNPPCPQCGQSDCVIPCKSVTKQDLVSFSQRCSVFTKDDRVYT